MPARGYACRFFRFLGLAFFALRAVFALRTVFCASRGFFAGDQSPAPPRRYAAFEACVFAFYRAVFGFGSFLRYARFLRFARFLRYARFFCGGPVPRTPTPLRGF